MQKAPPTPKGFRDIHPAYAKKRREIINIIAPVLEDSSFVPLETPTIEFANTLTGKYGDEEKLIYKFTDRGERELALRYDLTVPLARYIAGNQNLITKEPFRRYQIGQVFRGENPQRGRYREFTQFDFDSVGLKNQEGSSIEEDALIITTAINAARQIGLKQAQMAINDRMNFSGTPTDVIRAFDKIHKIGIEGVEKEITSKGYTTEEFQKHKLLFTEGKKQVDLLKLFSKLNDNNLIENKDYFFDPSLARGLDYYTGSIFELKPTGESSSLSIGAGGRYDNLIGTFAGKQIPAVGFSFGLDRIVDLLL